MKYKIKKLTKKGCALPVFSDKKLPVCRDRGLPRAYSDGFDFGFFGEWQERLPIPYRPKRSFSRRLLGFLLLTFSKISDRIRDRRKKERITPSTLCGALCASLAVALLCGGFVLYTVLIKDYFTPYRTVTIPRFEGQSYPDSESFLASDDYVFSVSYEHNADIPAGQVISQTPSPDILRKIYLLRGELEVELVVSLGAREYKMPRVSSENLREVMLELKNAGIKFEVSESYSSDVPKGEVISTTPRGNAKLTSNDTVRIVMSLGEERKTVTVPNLCSLSDSRARSLIESAGLVVGKISYVASDAPAGTVISQSHAAHTRAYLGEVISFSVSTGRTHTEKLLPDLHGLSLERATETLAAYGLTLGNVYYVKSAARAGTVISQTPIPKTPITPDIYSIDLYVSS